MEFKRKDIPRGFPIHLADKELKGIIDKAHNVVADSEFNTEVVARFSPVVQVAQSELQQRASNRLAHSANILAIVALVVGLASVALDVITFLGI